MWARLINAALGIWLMAAPAVLGYGGEARTNDVIVGPIAASFAIIAIWEVTRRVRWVNLLLATWLMLAPWVLWYGSFVPTVNSLVVGVIMAITTGVTGPLTQQFGGGWSMLWRSTKQRSS